MDKVRRQRDERVVGLSRAVLKRDTTKGRPELPPPVPGASIEEEEAYARSMQLKNPFRLFWEGTYAALVVFGLYLVTLDTIVSCSACVGMTMYWYIYSEDNPTWDGSGMDWIILGFAVVTPMTSSLTMAFRRRERALMEIARVRSFSFQIYLAHALWDWPENGGRSQSNVDWVEHCDFVMAQLIGMGDELCRFLSLPTSSRSRHRMTKSGRREAARTVKAAYRLFDSLYTQRMARLTTYDERLRAAGVGASEISRLRQYERWMGEAMENLRMLKSYRTPQALRSFARIFTLILPAFYAPTFAQLARDVQSLGMGICFGLLIAVGLSGLFNAIQVLEDPFVGYLTLDGINVTEEFEVLHWQQLVNARAILFPDAFPFPIGTRTALVSDTTIPELLQASKKGLHKRVTSWDKENLAEVGFGQFAGELRTEEDDPSLVSEDAGVPLADIRISEFAQYLPEEELDVDEEDVEVKVEEAKAAVKTDVEAQDVVLDIPDELVPPPSPTPARHRRTPSRTFKRTGSQRRGMNRSTHRRSDHNVTYE